MNTLNGYSKSTLTDLYALTAAGGHFPIHSGRNNEKDKLVRTDASGYLNTGWINTTSGNFTGTPNRIYASNDAYIRYMTPANFFPTLTNTSNLLDITIGGLNRKLTVAYATSAGNADTVDNKHASYFMPVSGSYISGTTVADVKTNLLNYFKTKPATTNAYTSSTFVNNFGNDSYTIENSSVCGWIALNPGYDNYNHGHFLVSEYGNGRLRHVGLGYNTWYGPYTIAYTSDIPTVTNYYWANLSVQSSASNTTVPSFGAIRMNGAASTGTNYITGSAGRIYFGGNFHLDSLGSNATYINHYTANNVYLCSGSSQGNVGIGTATPGHKLQVQGRIMTSSDLVDGIIIHRAATGVGAFVRYLASNLTAIGWRVGSLGNSNDFAFEYSTDTFSTTTRRVLIKNTGDTYIYGNLYLGSNDTRNFIAFRGTTGDNPGSYNHTYIGENIWGSSESSELVLYKGNDVGTTVTTAASSGPDRIRHIAAGHLFQIYKSALAGTFEAICTSTVPVNMLAIHQTSIQTYAPLVIIGDRYEGNYGINMSNSNIVGLNAIFTLDLAESANEGYLFKRTDGNYDSIWCSNGTFYFSPNGNNASQNGSYSTNYTVLHTGNYTGTLDGRYVNVTGDTMTGALNFANGTWNKVGDDSAMGDCNKAGLLGIKSLNNNLPGIAFFNSSGTLIGSLYSEASVPKWSGNTIWHAGNDGSGSGLDADTVDGVHASSLPQIKYIGNTGDFCYDVILLCKRDEVHQKRLDGMLFTTGGGICRYHCADVHFWHSCWSVGSYDVYNSMTNKAHNDYNFEFCTCTYGGAVWYAIRLCRIQAVTYYFMGSHDGINFSLITYYNSNSGVKNSEINNSISLITSNNMRYAGNIYAKHFYESSDIVLKENIKSIVNSDNIPQLKAFDWKSDGSHSYGLIALELEEMGYSELVSNNGSYKTVNYSAALSLIVGKLQVKIRELEKEIENLKNKN